MKFLFRFFCFEPLIASDTNNYKIKYRFYCWYIVHFILWSFQFTTIWIYQDLIFFTSDLIGKFSDIALFLVAFAAYFSFHFESIRHRKKYLEIFAEIHKLEVLLHKNRFQMHKLYAKFNKKYISRLIVFFVLYFLIITLIYINRIKEVQSSNFSKAFNFQASQLNLKQFHFVFYIQLVGFHFKLLNEQLVELINFFKYNEKSLKNFKYNKFLIGKLKICETQYNILFNISELMNEVMGPAMYMCNISLYLRILANVYWFIFRIMNADFHCYLS